MAKVEHNNFVFKTLYSISLGVIIAFFIGLGIEAFYPSEKYPTYPVELSSKDPGAYTEEQRQIQADYENTNREYQERMEVHNKYVSIIAIIASIVVMTISLLIVDKTSIFSNGLLLGSLLTLFYSIIRGMMSDDNKYRFIVVSIGLVVILVLGYLKFVKREKSE